MKEDILDSIRNLREEIREKVKDEVLSEYEKAREENKYPWEGTWMTPEQISTVQKRLKKKDKVVFLEMMMFFFFLFLVVLPMSESITVHMISHEKRVGLRYIFKVFQDVAQQSPESPGLKGAELKPGEDRKINEGKKSGSQELSRVTGDEDGNSRSESQRGKTSAVAQYSGPTKSEAPTNSGTTVSRKDAGKNNTYFIQVGAWKKVSYARKAAEKLKVRYPSVFIEQRNNLYKVRIREILGEEQGAAVSKEIRENFNFTPLLVKRK